ncbi:hypothetical protein [Pseudomonas sp. Marseille-Q5115]|uniref:hypothetical protein n=1 Tax=Pseudomonas sp. Marseille-Q5115 TaxID=2866593 RepID=UPI001CE47E92|nr:hypothetical protein [Pseudomonas sp. Marseille-Q5115]
MDESFSPTRKRSKKPTLFLAIDMWGIEGEYGDGNWHELLRQFALDWAVAHPDQPAATLWSSVQPCTLFPNGSSCYVAGSSKLPEAFLQQLERLLRSKLGNHACIGGEVQVNVDEWRVYLHFERGEVWEPYDGFDWRILQG